MSEAWTDQLSGEHEPHRGNHEGYACGFSGPHCWLCGEPWPCRAERGVTVGPVTRTPGDSSKEPTEMRDPAVDWNAVERLVYEAGLRGDITVDRGREILGIQLRTWRDRCVELRDEGDAALLDQTLAAADEPVP